MRALKLIPPLLAVGALAACATQGSAPASGLAASSPAPMAGYDWFLDQDEQELTLAYGVANSDEMRLQLVCQSGSGALQLAAMFDTPARVLQLESGGDTERYPARSESAGIHDGQYVSAEARTKDPVFQRFRSLGWIALWEGDKREAFAAHPAARPQIERFFSRCG